ncbi:MAG: iron uptake system protein EfeO [Acidimicrobiales bacterium]
MTSLRALLPVPLAIATLVVATSCTDDDGGSGASARSGTIEVSSTDDACTLSASSAPSGVVRFQVTNDGSKVTELYLLGTGDRVVSEVETIGPGLRRELVTEVEPGRYTVACKPGMKGDGIRERFTVTDSGRTTAPSGKAADLLAKATKGYATYVEGEAADLLAKTKAFAAAYAAGDDDAARAAYAPTRVHWERIEPVAESFGDLDPKLDLREADLEDGQAWTGWHRIEKDLWPPATDAPPSLTPEQRKELSAQLVADTQTLVDRTQDLRYTPSQLGNGAKELLDEVATGKITGEEEIWSHTDLWDFQANVDGARVAYELLRPVVRLRDPQLAKVLDREFTDVQALLDAQRDGDGFVTYDQLSDAEVKAFADAVNALGEPLSQLTSTVVR